MGYEHDRNQAQGQQEQLEVRERPEENYKMTWLDLWLYLVEEGENVLKLIWTN